MSDASSILNAQWAEIDEREAGHFAAIVQSADDAIIGKTLEGVITSWNLGAQKTYGYAEQEMLGRSVSFLVPPGGEDETPRTLSRVAQGESVARYETARRRKDGQIIQVSLTISPITDAAGRVVGASTIARDITERKRAETELRRANRALRTLCELNQALVRASVEPELLGEICRVAVHTGGYRLAWVGLAEPDEEKTIRPAAHAGYEAGYLDTLKATWADTEQGRGPGGTAIRTGQPAVCRNIRADPSFSLWRNEALRRGYASALTLPLLSESKALGILALYSAEIDAFDAVEVKLLDELAQDLAYGIVALRTRAAQAQAEAGWRLFRHLTNQSNDAIFGLHAPTGRVVDVNDTACRVLGYSRDELLRLRSADFDPNLGSSGRVEHLSVLQTTGSLTVESRHQRKDGTTFPVEVSISRTVQDQTEYLVAVARDITERKRAEAALRNLSRAVEQSPVSIVITDPAGNIEYVNPKFTAVTGYTPAEALGRNPRLLKGGELPPEEYTRLWQTITAGKEWRGEFHNRKKNGELYWELASISPILDAAGVITHFVAVKEDITERRRLEGEIRQAHKLEAVGQLAGGVAHDFNNILAAILLHLGLLGQDPRLTPELKAGLRDLETEARRAANLTRQLLLFSRRQALNARPVDLNEVVNQMTRMLRRLIGEDINLVFQGQGDALWVLADEGMTGQVVMNLCVNARDAMPRGGHLTIGTGHVELDAESAGKLPEARAGSFVCLSVADTGCGMDEATQRHVFEPFFTTKEVGQGTGLGLATVYGIVKEHRGWVQVQSAVDRGTTFRVYLPALPGAVERPAATEGDALRGGRETLLVVEDEPALRRLVSYGLRHLGYVVWEAANGADALKLWAEHRQEIDLLLTDMVMPGDLTGLELAERLRPEKETLRVIVTSGYHTEKTRPETLTTRGITYLAKPYDVAALARTVRRCLEPAANHGSGH